MDLSGSITSLLKRVNAPADIQNDLVKLAGGDTQYAYNDLTSKTFEIKECSETKKKFLCCDFNRYEKSFRSPYSNKYMPNTNAPTPSRVLREIEVEANTLFEEYKDSFYKNGVCSVYIKETSERSYAICFAVKKEADSGSTDAMHIIDVIYDGHHKILFKITTKLIITVKVQGFDFKASITKCVEESINRSESSKQELTHMLKMIENQESNLKKTSLNFIQSKSIQIANSCRFFIPVKERNRDRDLIKNIWTEQARNEISNDS